MITGINFGSFLTPDMVSTIDIGISNYRWNFCYIYGKFGCIAENTGYFQQCNTARVICWNCVSNLILMQLYQAYQVKLLAICVFYWCFLELSNVFSWVSTLQNCSSWKQSMYEQWNCCTNYAMRLAAMHHIEGVVMQKTSKNSLYILYKLFG